MSNDTQNNKRSQLAINLDSDTFQKFVTLYNEEKAQGKITQAQLFAKMMDAYEKNQTLKTDSLITVTMYLLTPCKIVSPQKIDFVGKAYFPPILPMHTPLDGQTALKLNEEFNCLDIRLIHAYEYMHNIDIYRDNQKGCYVVKEVISVVKRADYHGERVLKYSIERDGEVWQTVMPANFCENPLELSRFKYISNFDDFVKYFGRYASRDDLIEIGEILAEDIGEKYERMDELFLP